MVYKVESYDSGCEGILSTFKSDSYAGQSKIKRSAEREKFLLKMFSIREMLKWKYNYFEANPREHRIYWQCLKRFKDHRKTFKFKKLWRLKMDELYTDETLKAQKILIQQELNKLEESTSMNEPKVSVTLSDPTRLLVNYDREVLNMMRRVRDEYNFYLRYPKCFPGYEEEFKEFLIQLCDSDCADFKDLSVTVDDHFSVYWGRRVPALCDRRIAQEKQQIRNNWKKLLPVYFDISDEKACPEELQSLLLSENEGDDEGKKGFEPMTDED